MEYTETALNLSSGRGPDEGIGEDIITETQENHPNQGEMVFKTKEEFQKQFDYEWNKRYREQNKELAYTKGTLDEVTQALADFLGVEREKAVDELKTKVYGEPQQEVFAPKVEAEELLDALKEQNEALKAQIGEFDLENALQNQEFLQAVTHFYQTSPQNALERAVRAVYFDVYQEAIAKRAEEAFAQKLNAVRNRVPEGAVSPVYAGAVKPIDLDRLGSKGILELQNRILKGEKILF